MRKERRIVIIGAGSLGSYTTQLLAAMGHSNITVYDADVVEFHNYRNQLYAKENVGSSKVESLKKNIKFLTDMEIEIGAKFYTPEDIKTIIDEAVIIILVDSMETRKNIFGAARYNPKVKLFIDARTGGHIAAVYALNPCNSDGVKYYEEELYSDKEAADIGCANQTTLPTVWTVAAVIGKIMDLWSENGWQPICERVLINYEEEEIGVAWESFVLEKILKIKDPKDVK